MPIWHHLDAFNTPPWNKGGPWTYRDRAKTKVQSSSYFFIKTEKLSHLLGGYEVVVDEQVLSLKAIQQTVGQWKK